MIKILAKLIKISLDPIKRYFDKKFINRPILYKIHEGITVIE